MDTFERVKAILVDILTIPADKVMPEAYLMNDLGADSLAVVEITMAVEEEFGVKIDDDLALSLETVRQIVECIEAGAATGAERERETSR